jgi:hypothetical protein
MNRTPTGDQARSICEVIFSPVEGENLTDAARRALDLHDRSVRPLGTREHAAAIALLARAYPEDHRIRHAAEILIGDGSAALS